jgi:hypothetical protein
VRRFNILGKQWTSLLNSSGRTAAQLERSVRSSTCPNQTAQQLNAHDKRLNTEFKWHVRTLRYVSS